jgi:hypothetical protein
MKELIGMRVNYPESFANLTGIVSAVASCSHVHCVYWRRNSLESSRESELGLLPSCGEYADEMRPIITNEGELVYGFPDGTPDNVVAQVPL